MLDLSRWRAWLWPNSWWWIRTIFPYSVKFYISSCNHDYGYTNWTTKEDKEIYDANFYNDCLSVCTWVVDRFFALFYYLMVSEFWFIFFNYKK